MKVATSGDARTSSDFRCYVEMGAFNAVRAANEVAEGAIREAIALAHQEYLAAVAELECAQRDQACDLDAQSAALGRALSAWVRLEACLKLDAGARRSRSSARHGTGG